MARCHERLILISIGHAVLLQVKNQANQKVSAMFASEHRAFPIFFQALIGKFQANNSPPQPTDQKSRPLIAANKFFIQN